MMGMGDKGTNHLALNEVAHGLQAFYLDQNSKLGPARQEG